MRETGPEHDIVPKATSKMARRLKVAGVALAILLVVAVGGFYAWTRAASYPAFPAAVAVAGQARAADGWYVFEPSVAPTSGVIFYPGGLVDPAAYAPLMRRLSDRGVLAVIVPMPLELAVFGIGRADDVIAAYPGIDSWVISGHSLGGAMAAEYVKQKPDAVAGVALLASYPADSTDLSASPVKALVVYGTQDGVSGDVFKQSLRRLPQGAVLVTIDGGNHAQFGDYGPQKGDGTATISRGEQQRRTADAILELVGTLR
jgi:dienelactone hydrolase